MQPNSVGNGGAQPVSPVRPVNPVSQAKPVEPVKAAAPVSGPTFDNGPSVVEPKGGRKTGWIIGLVLMALIAAGGVGFGVWAYMDGNAQKNALNTQISSLKQQVSSLQDQLSEVAEPDESLNELNGDIALDLLREAVSSGEYEAPYGIGYANIYAKYNGTDKVSYWVKYWPTHIQNNEVAVAYDIIFTKNDDGSWDFELPGFTGYTDDLITQYTVLRNE